MSFDVQNPYFRTKVLTASPEELRLLLLEGALHFARLGRDGMERKDWEAVYDGFTQAKAIILELIGAMKPELAPELCRNLSALYTYIHRLLIESSFEKTIEKADEAIRLLEFERETWSLLMTRLIEEHESPGGAESGGASPTAPATSQVSAAYKPLSVQG